MKTVEYMGQSFDVPDWAKYVAADLDGYVYVGDVPPRHSTVNGWLPASGKWDCVGCLDKVVLPVQEIP